MRYAAPSSDYQQHAPEDTMTEAPTTMQDLRAARRRAELRQADVAKQLGMPAPYISMMEKSGDVLPTPEFAARYIAAVAAAAGEKR